MAKKTVERLDVTTHGDLPETKFVEVVRTEPEPEPEPANPLRDAEDLFWDLLRRQAGDGIDEARVLITLTACFDKLSSRDKSKLMTRIDFITGRVLSSIRGVNDAWGRAFVASARKDRKNA